MQAGAGQGDLPAWQLMECQRASSCTGMWVQVAMLFMTRGPLHHEDSWAAWFEAAADTLPISLATSLGCDKASLAQVGGQSRSVTNASAVPTAIAGTACVGLQYMWHGQPSNTSLSQIQGHQ